VEAHPVESRGPAHDASLRQGDLVLAINGATVRTVDDLHRFLSDWPIGQPAELTVVGGKELTKVTIKPAEAA
jgi:S1-C subfamily serine protease